MSTPAQFTTLTTEGSLLPSDLISRLVNDTRSLPGTRDEDYRLTPGRQLREIINRSWNDLLGAWQVFQPQVARLGADDFTAALTRDRWLLPLFAELGYGRLERIPEAITIGDKDYPVSHHHEQAFVHLVGWNVRLDRRTAGVVGAAKAAPHSMVQELLNRTDDHLWAIVSNGRQLRILRDNSSLTRAAYVEFDLEQMFSEGIFTDFVALWLLVHASRIEGDPQTECWLETWTNEARQQGVRALDTLGRGFEDAIATLGQGFLAHPNNNTLRQRLRDGDLAKQDYYRQLLRLVYRLVFLMVAEDRSLLHPPEASAEARERYARYYSISRVRDLARRRRGTKHGDLWDQLVILTRSLGPDGQPLLGLPALNSGLWAADGTADLDYGRLSNTYLLAAMRSLAYTRQEEALHRVDYRNLGSEELGSVYESLLELHPDVDQAAASFSLARAAGNERKTSGSYYTPTSLISALLDTALDPVIDDATAQPDPESALLDLKILDPACGSGHFLVAASHRIARRLAEVRTGETDPAPHVFRQALRQVIGRCIYGIDINPMAVELCKVSLWLESVQPGKPLSFLDHHILCGNPLLGTTPKLLSEGIPDEAFAPLKGDDRKVVSELKRRNRAERSGQNIFELGFKPTGGAQILAKAMEVLEHHSTENSADILEMEQLWSGIQQSVERSDAKFVADAWCASFVNLKIIGAPILTEGVFNLLTNDPQGVDQTLGSVIERLASQYQFLHLYIAFPGVFHLPEDGDEPENRIAGWNGGFDVVASNPPWERVKLQEQEWFASREPSIAAETNSAKRKRLIARLADEDPQVLAEFLNEIRSTEGEVLLLKGSGRYPLCGRGDINTFAVFTELARDSVNPKGMSGLIVPSKIATSDTTKDFFADIVTTDALVNLFEFNNRGFFADVAGAQGNRFCLLTMSGSARKSDAPEFIFGADRVEDLADGSRRFSLDSSDLALLSPNTGTCPVFRSSRDAELTKSIYHRLGVIVNKGSHEADPWGLEDRIRRLFDMGNPAVARECVEVEPDITPNDYLPMYEAKMMHQFTNRFGDYRLRRASVEGRGVRQLPSPSLMQLMDPNYEPAPRYWAQRDDVISRLHPFSDAEWILGWRDITSAIDERTVIAAVLPVVATDFTLRVGFTKLEATHAAFLLAALNSFVFDYCARQKIGGTHLSDFVFKQLPIPTPDEIDIASPWDPACDLIQWLVPRVLELSYCSWSLKGFAQDLGRDGPPFQWNEERRALLRAEIDGCFFHLYGITREDVLYILGTFPIVQRKDEAAYGEYRTARLIVERYDAMSRAIEAGSAYQGILG